MPTITPTIGRIVWYTPSPSFDSRSDKSQPLAAIVCRVNPNGTVNLGAFNQEGIQGGVTNVPLLQGDDPIPSSGDYAQWMPYQLKQAALNTEQLSALPSAQIAALNTEQLSALST